MYKKKYLKYKEKYNNLLKLKGGEFRTKPELCIKTNKFIVEFLNIITSNKENEESKGDIEENKTINDKMNSLYIEALNEDKSISDLLRDLFFLFDIEIIENKYKNPIVCDIDYIDFPPFACLENIGVWDKPYRLEDFWRCTIEEFMDEYDNFEKTEQSYLLFWDNLLNITSLLCRIKSCNYYFIKTADDSAIPTSEEEYNKMIENNKIVLMENISPNLLEIKLILTKIIFKINIVKYKNLLLFLLKSFNCYYDNILNFYLELLCFLKEIEICNKHFINGFVDLSTCISNICVNTDMNLKNKYIYLYLSLNLPKESTYARNEYTKFICSSINGLKLTDNHSLSLTQIVAHDYSFHKASVRKLNMKSEITKKDFRSFIIKIKEIQKELHDALIKQKEKQIIKDELNKVNNIEIADNEQPIFINLNNLFKLLILPTSNEFNAYKDSFFETFKKEYENFNINNFFEMVHYCFHEKKQIAGCEAFTIEIFNKLISHYFLNLYDISRLSLDEDLLKFYKNIIKYLLISKTHNNINILDSNNLLKYLLTIVIISDYLKNNKIENEFALYSIKLNEKLYNLNIQQYKKYKTIFFNI